jgi:class 3 adenylate cyclase
METTTAELVLAVTRVPGFTKACETQGDSATFPQLSRYYELVAESVMRADGRVVKVMGDAVLLTFPDDRCGEAVVALRVVQEDASELWSRFDERCHVQVKVGVGQVVCGPLGAPGEERYDIAGDALNQLFKAPWGDFELTAEVMVRCGL